MGYRKVTVPVFALALFLANDVLAQDPDETECEAKGYTAVGDTELVVLLEGNVVFAEDPSKPGVDWKEEHCSGGGLYKLGVSVNDPVDPRKKVGTWVDNGDGTVTYTYDAWSPGEIYTWRLYKRGKGASLCWGEDKPKGELSAEGLALPGTGLCPSP